MPTYITFQCKHVDNFTTFEHALQLWSQIQTKNSNTLHVKTSTVYFKHLAKLRLAALGCKFIAGTNHLPWFVELFEAQQQSTNRWLSTNTDGYPRHGWLSTTQVVTKREGRKQGR